MSHHPPNKPSVGTTSRESTLRELPAEPGARAVDVTQSGSGGGELMQQWGSLTEFWAMGGYGLYVWTSFGATALCMVWEVFAVWRRHASAAAESRDVS